MFDELPRLVADVRRNAHVRADAELRGIRAFNADGSASKSGSTGRTLHRREVHSQHAAGDPAPQVLQPGAAVTFQVLLGYDNGSGTDPTVLVQ